MQTITATTDPREYIKATDVALIYDLTQMIHASARDPIWWRQIPKQLDRTARGIKERYRYALGFLADLVHEVARARNASPVDRHLPRSPAARKSLIPRDDIYFRIASLLPPDHPHCETAHPASDAASTPAGLLLRRILEPAILDALEQRVMVVQTELTAAQLQSCIQASTNGVLTFTTGGECVFYNRRASELLGAPGHPLPGPLRQMLRRVSSISARSPRWLERTAVGDEHRTLHAFPFYVPKGYDGIGEALIHVFIVAEPDLGALVREAQRQFDLSQQEATVLLHIVEGLSYPKIATTLRLKSGTVYTYADRCGKKLGVSGREALIKRVYSMLPKISGP